MAKTDSQARIRAIYVRTFRWIDEWNDIQVVASAKLNSVALALGRLKLFEATCTFDKIKGVPDMQELVSRRQLSALEDLFKDLQEALCRFQEIVTLLKNSVTAAQNAARDYGAGGKAGGKSMCSGPSVGDSLLGVKDCCTMFEQEYVTKKAILGLVTYDSTEEEVSELHKVFTEEVHINRGRLKDLYSIMVPPK